MKQKPNPTEILANNLKKIGVQGEKIFLFNPKHCRWQEVDANNPKLTKQMVIESHRSMLEHLAKAKEVTVLLRTPRKPITQKVFTIRAQQRDTGAWKLTPLNMNFYLN